MRVPRRHRAPGHRPAGRCFVAMCTLLGLALTIPATADAKRYLSRTNATKITKKIARAKVAARVNSARASCRPSFVPATSQNLRKRWRLWDCAWEMDVTDQNGVSATCTGKIRITGRRRGYTYKKLVGATCSTVPAPTPAPGSRQQQMMDEAIRHGIRRANELIALGEQSTGAFYYGEMEPTMCVFLNAARVRCPLYLWWEAHDTDANFYTRTTREIFQAFVFIEDLGTSVGFNAAIEPQSIMSFEPSRPYYMLCSDYYVGLPVCPASRLPIAYPPQGPPYPG